MRYENEIGQHCQICRVEKGVFLPAWASARMASVGSWWYLCEACFARYRCELGDGRGRLLDEE